MHSVYSECPSDGSRILSSMNLKNHSGKKEIFTINIMPNLGDDGGLFFVHENPRSAGRIYAPVSCPKVESAYDMYLPDSALAGIISQPLRALT